MEETKSCTTCGQICPLTNFFRDKNAKGGRTTICKDCSRIKGKAWRSANKERLSNTKKEYYKNNQEKIQEYRRCNRDKLLEQKKIRRQAPEVRYHRAQAKAALRGLEWGLTLEQYIEAIAEKCTYCDGILGTVTQGVGLDRLTNTIGYLPGNVVSCCHTCNRIKGHDLDYQEARSAIWQVVKMRLARGEHGPK